jgi:hypothetical protein
LPQVIRSIGEVHGGRPRPTGAVVPREKKKEKKKFGLYNCGFLQSCKTQSALDVEAAYTQINRKQRFLNNTK